ncbi:von Willebrand factor D and EGF domain-containing protein-like [Mizuhopecten yessoensis]|uniref:von Willebrand factor D and EGF domain-containing protein-like n=1 Tax=Mizuhopecten yessoensis TaxID=6573 RepID=UPI000B45C989|nr:von Willebrand factor D and EGF domain-containing protein-like [Mizuhopecten yessoensis]
MSGAGGTIPSSAPKSYQRCGTRNPVWMFDTLPSDGVTKFVNVCGRSFFFDCSAVWQIEVKNCGAFYVYYLQRPPGDFGYCFGTEMQCPDGETSATGFTPGCKYALDTTFTVSVNTGLDERIGKPPGIPEVIPQDFKIHEIKFECGVHFPNGENPALFVYDVDWYINDNLLSSCSHSNAEYNDFTMATRLKEECWRDSYTLGFLVRCAIRLRTQSAGLLGQKTYSGFFKAGFETDKREYSVAEGESVDVIVRLTVPLGCFYPEDAPEEQIKTHMEQNCIITIRLQEIPIENVQCASDPIALKDTNCGLTFNHTHWDTPQTLTVYGASDNLVNVGSRSMVIKMAAKELVLYHNAWNSASIPSVLVTVEDLDKTVLSGECYSRNDPHMRTFDGRSWENQRIGEFVLYKHNEKPYWVHAVYQPCSAHVPNGVTCNCGVAIRNNDALFVANFCREKIGWSVSGVTNSNRYIEKSFCDDTSMTIQENGNTYTVTLPTGTKITFNYYYRYGIGSIIVKPSLADWKSSSGLCGYMDGTYDKEFKLQSGKETADIREFALDWKIKTVDQSLFRENIDLTDAGLTLPRFCKCSEDSAFTKNVTCSVNTESNPCVTQSTDGFFQTCDSTRQKRSSSLERYRRASPAIDVIPKFPIIFGSDIDDEPQLIGDTRYMETTVASLATSCRLIAVKLENLTKTDSSDGTPGKSILDEMLELDCPNNCSGHGDCFNGNDIQS